MLFELIGHYSGKTMTVDSNHFTSSRQRRVEELNLEVCILLTFTSYHNLKGKAKIASNVLKMFHPVCVLLGLFSILDTRGLLHLFTTSLCIIMKGRNFDTCSAAYKSSQPRGFLGPQKDVC